MLTVGGLFDGIGLLAYGLHLAGLQHRWLCEVDPWRRGILHRRFPGIPVFDDVRAVDARCAEPVDVIAGGFPCKGASTAGKRNGFEHPETALWREMRRVVGDLRPRYVLVENVANLLALHDGAVWGGVLGDLAALGYDVRWDCVPAAAVGAPHLRDRVFAVAAHTVRARLEGRGVRRPTADGAATAADAARHAEGGPAAPAGADGQRAGARADAATPANAESQDRQGARSGGPALGRTTASRGVAVEWSGYEPAIRRWEAIHGPAPEPLVRRMDDRSASRVERSRLSALGDGVQVEVAQLIGAHLVELAGC